MVFHRKLLYVCVGIALLITTGCGPALGLVLGSGDQLVGTQWELESYGPEGSEVLLSKGMRITIAFFDNNHVGGTDGCNTFDGKYEVIAGRVIFKDLSTTMAVCTDDRLMHQETEYLQALAKADRYWIRGDRLVIWYDNGGSTLNYFRSTPPGLVGVKFGKG